MQDHLGYLTWGVDPLDTNFGILQDTSTCDAPEAYSVTTLAHEQEYGPEELYSARRTAESSSASSSHGGTGPSEYA
jgi:hypothetical protein